MSLQMIAINAHRLAHDVTPYVTLDEEQQVLVGEAGPTCSQLANQPSVDDVQQEVIIDNPLTTISPEKQPEPQCVSQTFLY